MTRCARLPFEVVRKLKGRVHIVFAHAGVVDPAPLAGSTPEQFDRDFGLNARGTHFTVQKVLPLLTDKGSIILSGSAAWQMGIPGWHRPTRGWWHRLQVSRHVPNSD
ncbi:MAG: SDR family oxidoreductase [Candidatus Acidiferrum sp.]